MMDARRWILLVLLLLLAACDRREGTATPAADAPTRAAAEAAGGAGASGQSAPEGVRLRMAVFDWESGSYGELISAFEAENPGIEIELVSVEETLGLDAGAGAWPEDASRRLVSAADVVSTGALG